MHCVFLSILLAICSFALADVASSFTTGLSPADVQKAFYDANIPQDIDIVFDPSTLLEVIFPQNSTTFPVVLSSPGTNLSVSSVTLEPSFVLAGADAFASYVIIMLDLDIPTPSNPYLAPYRHFMGGNYVPIDPGILYIFPLLNTTEAISSYESPAPSTSAPHRYVFLVYHQSPEFARQTLVTAATSRYTWNISEFTHAVGMGNPIGGTYMLVGAPQ